MIKDGNMPFKPMLKGLAFIKILLIFNYIN